MWLGEEAYAAERRRSAWPKRRPPEWLAALVPWLGAAAPVPPLPTVVVGEPTTVLREEQEATR